MDNPNTNHPNHTPNIPRRPLLWAATIAVILLVLAGIAAVNKGWTPNSNSTASRTDDRTASAAGRTGSNQGSSSFNNSGSAGLQPSAPSRQTPPSDPATAPRQ